MKTSIILNMPDLEEDFWTNAVIEYPEKKQPVTLRLHADMLECFKSKGRGYQTKISAVL